MANLRSAILSNVDVLPSLTSYVATGGRLNVCKAVPGCSTASTAVPQYGRAGRDRGAADGSCWWAPRRKLDRSSDGVHVPMVSV